MPKRQHRALEREGRKKGLKGEALQRFVFGTMENQKKKRAKGKRGKS